MQNKRYTVCEWTWVRVPVDICAYSWWELYVFAGVQFEVQLLESGGCFVKTGGTLRLLCSLWFTFSGQGCTGCARYQGRGWSSLELLTLMVRVKAMLTLLRTDSPYPQKIPSINCDCTCTAWEWGYSHVLLCKRHSRGTSIRVKT
jgi:hypothetical protein